MKKFKIVSVLMLIILVFGNPLFSQNDLVGTYYYQGNHELPLPNIDIDIYDSGGALIASTTTDENGFYSFTGIPNGEYYIESSTSLQSGGVDLFDALRVLFYVIGLYDLNEIEFAVADIDDSGEVTWSDYRFIRINHLIFGQPFPAGDWDFENLEIDFTAREASDTTNLWASSKGDVNGGWDPSGRDIELLKSSYYLEETSSMDQSSSLVIGTDYNGYLNGFNLNLAYKSDEISIASISGPDENFNYYIDDVNGVIRVSWLNENQGASRVNGDQLFVIEVNNLTNVNGSGEAILELLPEGMLLDSENNKLNNTEIKLPLLQNKQTIDISIEVYPNPVVTSLNFNVNLNKQSYASLSIYDLSGKLVNFIENIALHQGEQTINVNAENLLPGNYVYSLELKGESDMNMMGRFVKSK